MSHCQRCGRAIRWVETASGQRLPIDPDPVPDGIIMIHANGRARVVPTESRAGCVAPLFATHLATCANRPNGSAAR